MDPNERLSSHLRIYIGDMERDYFHEYPEDKEFAVRLEKAVSAFIDAIETFSDQKLEAVFLFLQELPNLLQDRIDEHFTKLLIQKVPTFVERFTRLSIIQLTVLPKNEVRIYMQEATRCFVFGFNQASIALSRAAMEFSLRDRFQNMFSKTPDSSLNDMLQSRFISQLLKRTYNEARDVQFFANRVVHEQPATEQIAFDVLVKARMVIRELYDSK